MKNILVLFLTCLLTHAILHAQIGKVGINTSAPAAMLHVKDSSVVFTGPSSLSFMTGPPPVSGAGIRMMWYPDKAAFRAGVAFGQQWNKDSIGYHSLAIGSDTRAFGQSSIALGEKLKVDGHFSVAIGVENNVPGQQSVALGSFLTSSGGWSTTFGFNNVASGLVSTAFGSSTEASGDRSVAMGASSKASGSYSLATGSATEAKGQYSASLGYSSKSIGNSSVAMGQYTISKPFASLVLGQYNDTTSISSSLWNTSDPVFIIGNGSYTIRSNAFTVLKSGKTGINTASPVAMLHVKDSSVVFTGLNSLPAVPGNPPISGSGIRMMWYPDKAAFRIGKVDGSQWDKIKVGKYSYASGENTTALGYASTALGFNTTARPYASLVLGRFNDTTALASETWNALDPVFIIGNGTATNARANAMTVLKNGNTGLGTISPAHRLHVVNTNPDDGGWAEGIVVENTSANTGEAAIAFQNISMPSGRHWMVGLNQNPNLAFNYGLSLTGSNIKMVIDTFGKVGISTITPAAKLHVYDGIGGGIHNYNGLAEVIIEDDGSSYIQFSNQGTFESGILSGNDTTDIRSALVFRPDSSVQIKTGGTNVRMTVTKAGFIGLATTTPSQRLHVVGNGLFTGTVTASCGVLACSDIRYKNRISPLTNSLRNVLALNGIHYYWDKEKFPDKAFGDERQIGFSAQELELIFPEMVHTDASGYKLVDYSRLTPVLVEAIKEQQYIIESQQLKFESLEKEMQELKSLVLQMVSTK